MPFRPLAAAGATTAPNSLSRGKDHWMLGIRTDPLPHAPAPAAVGAPPGRHPLLWPAVVAVAYTLVQLLLVVPGSRLGWDETVYVSQVDGSTPAAFFSAPRARGVSYLVAPVSAFTPSTTALRLYLAPLSGAGLFLALWAWRGLLPSSVLAWAGALFASLWITLFYGPTAMPNLWVALAGLAAVGCFLRYTRFLRTAGAPAGAGTAPLLGLALAIAVVAVIRPPDSGWLVLPLAALALCVRRLRHRPGLWTALVAGLVVGWAPWLVEAWASYGGLFPRLHRASEIQGGMGWNVAIGDQVRSLQGRTLCRPCHEPWNRPHTALWWFALPPLVWAGIRCATRAGRREAAVLATFVAASLSVPYLFLIDYAAPRFLLPAYALLALPVAECVRAAFVRTGRARRTVAAVTVLALAGHLTAQLVVLDQTVGRADARGERLSATAQELRRAGVSPPCTLSGRDAVPLGHYTGCASRQIGGHDGSATAAELAALADRMPVAIILPARTYGPRFAGFAHDWAQTPLPSLGRVALLSPPAGTPTEAPAEAGAPG